MSDRLEDLLSRQFRALDAAQRPIAVLGVLEPDRPVIGASPVSSGRDRLLSRPVSVLVALATIAAVVVLMLVSAPGETADPAGPVAVEPPSTAAIPEVTPSAVVPDVGPTVSPADPSSLDHPEPILAGEALDLGWAVVERQFDLTAFGEPGPHLVSDSAGLYWGLDTDLPWPEGLYVSENGIDWDPVSGGLPLEPGLSTNWTTLLRIGDTIVATFHWPEADELWVSNDRGRSFERVDNQAFETAVFAWSWVADDTFWQIVEDPERSNDPVPPIGERVNDETRLRQLWSSSDGASWRFEGDVDGLPAWDGGEGTTGVSQNNFGPHAVESEGGLLLLVNRRALSEGRGAPTVTEDPMIYRSEDAGLTWRPFSNIPLNPGGPTGTIGGWILSDSSSRPANRYVSKDGITWYTLTAPPRVDFGSTVLPTLVTRHVAIPPPN